jgi:hypothetical protein
LSRLLLDGITYDLIKDGHLADSVLRAAAQVRMDWLGKEEREGFRSTWRNFFASAVSVPLTSTTSRKPTVRCLGRARTDIAPILAPSSFGKILK